MVYLPRKFQAGGCVTGRSAGRCYFVFSRSFLFRDCIVNARVSSFKCNGKLNCNRTRNNNFCQFRIYGTFISRELTKTRYLPFSISFHFCLMLTCSFTFNGIFLSSTMISQLFFVRVRHGPLPPTLNFHR